MTDATETKRILIAEDNPGLAHVLQFNLEMAGLDVTLAETGSDAWLVAQADEGFDAVITMPGMTGVELCRKLRETDAYREIPIVMVTAREMELDVRRICDELQLAAIFAKPYSPGELLQTIESMIAAAE